MTHLIAILGLAALCGGWIALQRWIARADPGLPGIRRSCTGCTVPCDSPSAEPAEPRLDSDPTDA